MNRFVTAREAKEFLVTQIVEEARREGVSLTDTERKMLYFSETAWTLPDMEEVNEEFDRGYSQEDYERKIVELVGNVRRNQSKADAEAWSDAIRVLSKEDHYLLVLTGEVRLMPSLLGALTRLYRRRTNRP